ncbi:hypothetical protein ACS0TY_034326 [Phlomoides rotata]
MSGAVVVNGFWGVNRIECYLVNIYAPCPLAERGELWDRVQHVIVQNSYCNICIAGDFNSVRRGLERVVRRAQTGSSDMATFDDFIRDSELIDLPLHDINFTWYIQMDRAEAIFVGPLSHHVGNKSQGLGSQTIQILERMRSYDITGWGGYVIKEKLKRLKADLKQWNLEVFGSMDKKIEDRRNEILKLDLVDDVIGLEEHEIIMRNELKAALFNDLKCKESLLSQKARCLWVKEGDVNSRFFHNYINKHRKMNEISGVSIEGIWREEVSEVKQGVFEFLKKHFSLVRRHIPILNERFTVRKVSKADNNMLTAEFTESEVKAVLDSCDISKSPGPDDINLGFLRDFWGLIKDDLMRFMGEFHRMHRQASEWGYVVDKVKNRMRKWKRMNISIGGRLTLINSDLSSVLLSDDREQKKKEFKIFWNKFAIPKVRVHAWGVLWERIPTTTKLQKKRSLPQHVSLDSVFCNKSQETFWMKCHNWLGVESVLSSNPATNLLHFSRILKGKKGKLYAICIWEGIVWLLWKKRDNIIFWNEEIDWDRTLEQLKP